MKSLLLTNVEFVSDKEGDSILIENGRIISIGWEEVLKYRAQATAKVINCKGFFAIPGLTDSHVHLLSYGLYKSRLDLSNAASIEDIKKTIAEKVKRLGPGKWIIGRGWDQEKLLEKRMPNRWDLDEVAPANPVLLYRVCGHVAVVNSYALKIAGIDDEAKPPLEDYLGREDGRVNGVLYEKAIELVEKKVGKPSIREAIKAIVDVLEEAASYGLVELHAMSVDEYEYRVLSFMSKMDMLKLRIKAYLELNVENANCGKQGEKLEICGFKVLADGSFGARTAYLRAPYSDTLNVRGKLLVDLDKLTAIFEYARGKRGKIAVHAIGDGAIEEVLKAVQRSSFRQVRLEHASLTPPDIIKEIAELRIPVSVQPRFILSDWWITERLGAERTKWVYAYKSLLTHGVKVFGSSDAPVEHLNPWLGIYAAVDRGKKEGMDIWRFSNREALSLEDALKLYLSTKDYRIKEGAKADIIIVKTSPSRMEEIEKNKALLTIVNGQVVYRCDI